MNIPRFSGSYVIRLNHDPSAMELNRLKELANPESAIPYRFKRPASFKVHHFLVVKDKDNNKDPLVGQWINEMGLNRFSLYTPFVIKNDNLDQTFEWFA